MPEDLDLLKIVCHRLEQVDIPYMLTGSMAANFYTIPRMTRDIDIVIQIGKSDVEIFFRIFQQDFYIDKKDVSDAIEYSGMFNVIHSNSMLKVDLIVRENTPYEKTKFLRRNRFKIGDSEIWIISPEDLIISKLSWARDSLSEMQLKDINGIFSSQKQLDKPYILNWINLLQLNNVYEKVKNYE